MGRCDAEELAHYLSAKYFEKSTFFLCSFFYSIFKDGDGGEGVLLARVTWQ